MSVLGKDEKDVGHFGGKTSGSGVKGTTGVFIFLLAISAVGVSIAAFLVWYVPAVGFSSIHPWLPFAAGLVVLALTVFILLGMFAVAISLIGASSAGCKGEGRLLKSIHFRGLLIKFFLPLMIMAGGLLRIPRIKIEKAFIEINNDMVREIISERKKHGKSVSTERVLILLPHCIQLEDCDFKVTRDVSNCAQCGRCEIGELVGLSKLYGMEMFVLTGGTIARRRIKEFSPDAVLAVACERDLTSGVQDAYPLPVFGIVNKRPHGYCVATGVAVDVIKDAIEDLFGTRSLNPTEGALA